MEPNTNSDNGKNIRVRVRRQKTDDLHVDLPLESPVKECEDFRMEVSESKEDGCRIGRLDLSLKNGTSRESFNLEMDRPIKVFLPNIAKPKRITAIYMFSEWWTRPAFVDSFAEIPEFTQVALLEYEDRYACFVPMVGDDFKTYMVAGTPTEVGLEMTARLGGQREVHEPLYVLAEGTNIYEAVHKAFSWIAEYKGIKPREKRRLPEPLNYLGWCSWNAFYTDVSEDGILKKAEELYAKEVPVRWMIIDDGWMTARDEMLCDFTPDKTKFPTGFRTITDRIKDMGTVDWFGVWHALGGYWGGVYPGSPLEAQEMDNLYKTVNGKLIPSPYSGGFFRDWYESLSRDGIDFVKVDGQSSVPFYFENNIPISAAAREMDYALESGAYIMDGAIINCMGMAMESVLARNTSAVSRNSDDFFPDRENGFEEHLLQNAYNSIFHDEIYYCDWDMFWTEHRDNLKHSLIRAVSGGPVYFSDEVGATRKDILEPLVYSDGRVLMMDRSAKPTVDCVFIDPLKEGVLKLQNTAPWDGRKGGGIAAFNLTDSKQSYTFKPTDVLGIDEAETYWVYDYFNRGALPLESEEVYEGELDTDGYAWFVVLPKSGLASCLGLIDKYVGFTAVESVVEAGNQQTIVLRETGPVGWLSDREPVRVDVNGEDVTERVERDGSLYTLNLHESPAKAVLSISW